MGNGTPPNRVELLRKLEAEALNCRRCGLHLGRKKVVFGSGSPNPKLVMVGEAPGVNEDLQGLPFVGAAGKFLDSLLESIGLHRSEVYITNTIKCRPPGNRTPSPEEIEACRPFLEKQMKILMPKLVVALGRTAATTLLGKGVNITSEHGRFIGCKFGGTSFRLFLTYHPAAALYSARNRSKLQEDFSKLGEIVRTSSLERDPPQP